MCIPSPQVQVSAQEKALIYFALFLLCSSYHVTMSRTYSEITQAGGLYDCCLHLCQMLTDICKSPHSGVGLVLPWVAC